MKNLMIAGVMLAPFLIAPANANETEDFCVAFATENGWDTEPCACIGEAADSNPDAKAEILSFTSPEDAEAMSQSTKETIAHCFPNEGGGE